MKEHPQVGDEAAYRLGKREGHEDFKPLVQAVMVAIQQLTRGERANVRDIQGALMRLPLDAAVAVGLIGEEGA